MRELIDAVRDRRAVLFVGAGVSANLGVPSWPALSAHLAEDLGHDPEAFRALGHDQTLAEFYALKAGSLDTLRAWMDAEWHRDAEEKVRRSAVHRLIVSLGFPIVYTTNYDRYLELAYDAAGVRFAKVATLADVAAADPCLPQVVKYHGDLAADAPLVLTESSHFDRLSLDGPLDLKLRADLLGRVVLFVGYSVSDVSVRYLLYRLHRLWEASGYQQARPRVYVFLGQDNPVQAAVLASWGIVPLTSDRADAGEGLRLFLEDLLARAGSPSRG